MNILKTLAVATALSLSATAANAAIFIGVPIVEDPMPVNPYAQPMQLVWVQLPNGQYVQEYVQAAPVVVQPQVAVGGYWFVYNGHRYFHHYHR